jgi:hypothetical protein
MHKEKEEMIQRLTARYVSEFHAGKHPVLSEYLSRYPQYADSITDFVTYYHAMEVDAPQESETIQPLTQASRAAFDAAWLNVIDADSEVMNTLNSLQTAANAVHKSFLQVAMEIGLGRDVLRQLDQHAIAAATIPQEICYRLAKALHQPLAAIEMYLGLVKQKQQAQGVAESSTFYHVEDQLVLDMGGRSFQGALVRSKHMSGEQKDAWRIILVREGLS